MNAPVASRSTPYHPGRAVRTSDQRAKRSTLRGRNRRTRVRSCTGADGTMQSTGRASTGVRSIFCDRSVLANLRRADSFGGGLGCQLLYPEHHPSAVQPQVSADSVDRSCWRANVRFSVSLRVGSSGLLGDLAGDSGLHPADEREEVKVRLATKTLGPRGGGARAGSRH